MTQKQIGILGTAGGEQSALLKTALEARGATVRLLHPKKLTARLPQGGATAPLAGGGQQQLLELDALIVRWLPGGSLEQVVYRLNLLHRLEQQGLPVINSADTLERTVDKYYTTALLAEAGLPVPRTLVTEQYDEAMQAIAAWGRAVIKPVFGSLGQGLILVEGPDLAHRVLRALELNRYLYYVQEYLPHQGEDYRLFVIGGQVVGAMRRQGAGWRTNIAQGGQAEAFEPPAAFCELALRTAALLQADYLGVDILVSGGQAYLLEANGIPGWLGLQSVLREDIAGLLADYLLQRCEGNAQG